MVSVRCGVAARARWAGRSAARVRASLIAEGHAEEADLTLGDLSDGFLIGNALRGLMPAKLMT